MGRLNSAMDSPFTYYDILGVQPHATSSEIHQAYRSAMRQYHPDVNPAANAENISAMLNRAYAVLSDTSSRQNYDSEIGVGSATNNGSRPAPPRQHSTNSAQATVSTDPITSVFGWIISRLLIGVAILCAGVVVLAIAIHLLPFFIAGAIIFAIVRKIFR